MNKDDAKKYLRMLGQELQKQEITGEILLSDGMIALLDIKKPQIRNDIDAYLRGDETAISVPTDITAYFRGYNSATYKTAQAIGQREGLSVDWLFGALHMQFFTQPITEKWIEYPGLRAYLASAEHILTMRAISATETQDIEDMRVLAKRLHILTIEDMLSHIERYVPGQLLTEEMRNVVQKVFEE